MIDQPFFSILVPTYNQAHFITDAIEGVLAQTFEDYELVLMDDDSTDTTEEKVKPYLINSKVRYIKRPQRVGRVKNYNLGTKQDAKGQWIIICDGDDFYTDPNFLSIAHAIIVQNPGLVILQGGHYHGANLENATLHLPAISENLVIMDGSAYILDFAKLNHFSHLTTVFHAELARQTEMYTNDLLSSDINSLLKLAVFGKVALVKKAFALWRLHQTNASHTASFSKRLDNLFWIDDCAHFFEQHRLLISGIEVSKWRESQLIKSWAVFFVEAIRIWVKSGKREPIKEIFQILKKETLLTRIKVWLKVGMNGLKTLGLK